MKTFIEICSKLKHFNMLRYETVKVTINLRLIHDKYALN